MRRSKLELHVAILNVLANKGPLKLTHIIYKANVNCSVLNEYIDFLIKQGLVEKQIIKKERIVYSVTQRGENCAELFPRTYSSFTNHRKPKAKPILEALNVMLPFISELSTLELPDKQKDLMKVVETISK